MKFIDDDDDDDESIKHDFMFFFSFVKFCISIQHCEFMIVKCEI